MTDKLPIVYINLARDTQRRERMESEFERLHLSGERFDATLWSVLSEAEQARFYSPALNAQQFHKPLVNGEKGCYASHLRAWQMLLDSAHPALVVLEDDVKLTPQFSAVIDAIAALPPDWDMIKLLGRVAVGGQEKVRRRRPLVEGTELIDFQRVPSLTAAYVLSRSGAQKLLASRLPFARPIDVDLRHWWENGLRIQGVMPGAVELDETSFDSSVGTKAPNTPATRFKKFRNKMAYTVLNAWHRQ